MKNKATDIHQAEKNPREPAYERRAYIQKRVLEKGEVTDSEIAAEAARQGANWPLHAQSLKDDADHFLKHNIPISRPSRANKFIHSNNHSSYQTRKNIEVPAKEAIGQLAADLFRGAKKEQGGVEYTGDLIIEMLQTSGAAHNKDVSGLVAKIEGIYDKYDRLYLLDSGTTTLNVAQAFVNYTNEQGTNEILPDVISPIKTMTVLTNSTDISTTFNRIDSDVQVIMLGGRLRKETNAFAGALTKVCLEAWNMQVDITMVGAVGVKRRNQNAVTAGQNDKILGFMSDTFEEAETKQAAFSRSMLRVILIDSSKFKNKPVPKFGHYIFSNVSRNDVDLIITDDSAGIEGDIAECWKNDVAVLVAGKKDKKIQPPI